MLALVPVSRDDHRVIRANSYADTSYIDPEFVVPSQVSRTGLSGTPTDSTVSRNALHEKGNRDGKKYFRKAKMLTS